MMKLFATVAVLASTQLAEGALPATFTAESSTVPTTATSKADFYANINLADVSTGSSLYFINTDYNEGCAATSGNTGKLHAKVEGFGAAAGTDPTCTSPSVVVSFNDNWKGCETLAYAPPTNAPDGKGMMSYKVYITETTAGTHTGTSNADRTTSAVTTILTTLESRVSSSNAKKIEFCYDETNSAPVACTCPAVVPTVTPVTGSTTGGASTISATAALIFTAAAAMSFA